MANTSDIPHLPRAFIWRHLHSLTGLGLVLFLIEHLFINSQAALFIGDDGHGFITTVDAIKKLPYLTIIEIILLGVPFLIHAVYGIRYLFTATYNSFPSDGSKPSLTLYARNHAYTWQRITAWLLLIGISAHVIHMRILEYPTMVTIENTHFYLVRINSDRGLYTLSTRLGFELYDADRILKARQTIPQQLPSSNEGYIAIQKVHDLQQWLVQIEAQKPQNGQVIVMTDSFGIAQLLILRDTFKSPIMILLYFMLVLAACFHAFNGLWTFMISWGITLTATSQRYMRLFTVILMAIVTLLGLTTICGTYWVNLRQ